MARMLLDILRTLSVAYSGTVRFGSRADDTALLLAIFIGQAEGRPMTPHKLADFGGLPRPTVVRRIKSMMDEGLLVRDKQGHIGLPIDKLNSPNVLASVEASLHLIHNASAELSRLDSVAIARQKPK